MKHIHAKIACAVLGAAFAVGIGTSLTYGESPEIVSPSPSLRKAIETRAIGETLAATFDSDAVVSASAYQAYSNEDWGVTFGGNNKSVGTNTNNDPSKDNRPKCVLTGDNAKYAVAGTTTASAIYNINRLESIGRISLQYTGGSNYSRGVLYLLHSDDNVTFNQVNLTGEFPQGDSIGSTNTEYSLEFDALDGYFALVIADTGDSGNFRFDNVIADFYSVSTTPIPDDVKPVSISLAAGEGKLSYYAGDEFDPTGFEVSLTYGSESDPSFSSVSSLEVDDSRLTWNYDLTTVGEGKELTVTFNEADIELTSNALTYDVLEAPDGQDYYFGKHTDFLNDWTSSYEKRTLAYEGEFSIVFSSADKNSSTITDMPVSKGGEATLTSLIPMSKIEFGFKQWGSKPNTASLYIDGGSTAVDSAAFLDGVSSVSYVSDSPFSTAKVDWSSNSNQVGWNYVYIEYASVEPSQAESYAETFIKSMTCDGKGAITAVEGTWETLSERYADLSDSDKRILKEATPDENSEYWVEQAVARYDYIVGKYGVEQYPDFMGRTPARIAEARSVDVNDQTAAWVIAGISAAGIASAAAFFFLRRRKEA